MHAVLAGQEPEEVAVWAEGAPAPPCTLPRIQSLYSSHKTGSPALTGAFFIPAKRWKRQTPNGEKKSKGLQTRDWD